MEDKKMYGQVHNEEFETAPLTSYTSTGSGTGTSIASTTQGQQLLSRNDKVIICVFAVLVVCIATYLGLAIFDSSYYDSDPAPQLDSLVVSLAPHNVSTSSSPPKIANIDIGFSIQNLNTYGNFQFDQIEVLGYYEKELLIKKVVKPFDLHPQNGTSFKESSSVLENQLTVWASNSIAEDMKHGYVTFSMDVQGWVNLTQFFGVKRRWMTFSCPEIRIGFVTDTNASTSTILGESKCITSLKGGGRFD